MDVATCNLHVAMQVLVCNEEVELTPDEVEMLTTMLCKLLVVCRMLHAV